jgi:hypothetical protein
MDKMYHISVKCNHAVYIQQISIKFPRFSSQFGSIFEVIIKSK